MSVVLLFVGALLFLHTESVFFLFAAIPSPIFVIVAVAAGFLIFLERLSKQYRSADLRRGNYVVSRGSRRKRFQQQTAP